jgi:glucokinase
VSEEIVVTDIGGTHARFAIAEVADGAVLRLDEPITLKTAEYASLQTAWEAFGAIIERGLPRAAGIAMATPIAGKSLKLTNNPWVIQPAQLSAQLGLDRHVLINDFGAVGHAVANLPHDQFLHLAGPDISLPQSGLVSVIGPGTGLGVASVLKAGDHYHVIESEGGHIEFPSTDSIEDAILTRLRQQFTRVSAERVVSGPGLAAIYLSLAALEGRAVTEPGDAELWTRALDGSDSLAAAAFERFCLCLGTVAGDIVLAQGAKALVIGGGLGLRIAARLGQSDFAMRFVAKGRFQGLMEAIQVRVITHPQAGLFGAAAAFAQEFRT